MERRIAAYSAFTIFHILGAEVVLTMGTCNTLCFYGYDAGLKNHAFVLLLVVQFCCLLHD
jgi:hypothetical protein